MQPYRKNIPWPTPGQMARWVAAGNYRVWLDSALPGHPGARQSLLCGEPVKIWQWGPGDGRFEEVTRWMRTIGSAISPTREFCGGVVGFLCYEAWPPDLSWARRSHPHLPWGHWMAVDTGLVLDHHSRRATVFSWGWEDGGGKGNRELARGRMAQLTGELLESCPEGIRNSGSEIDLNFSVSRKDYLARVRKIQEAIDSGDFYQVNYAHPVEIRGCPDPAELYLAWRAASPAPQMVFWNLPEGRILSASPETLLQIEGRQARSFPIKGTRPRGATGPEDEALRRELWNSEKDAAELLMIVDLVRNDLGKVCELGSISVPRLKKMESFPYVHHLVAEVAGRLSPDVSPLRALLAMFPGGSITGAPKRKAMEWIHALEARPRGIYTGSMGYWGFNGQACFNIAIRTGFYRQGVMEYWVGSGIVADSEPEAESQETLDKFKGLLKGLGINGSLHLS